ncbi:MAG: cobalamin biosynthesis protein CobQ [Pseudomonadota bacterium]
MTQRWVTGKQTETSAPAPALARRDYVAIGVGALAPDAILYGLYGWARFVQGLNDQRIFRVEYFSDTWQAVLAIGNSAPLYAVMLAAGVAARVRWLWLLAASALLHVATDLPLHHDDGHSHFWPFTMWKFQSPVSYWDPTHFGHVVMPLEILLFLACGVVLFRRFTGLYARLGVGLVIAAQLAGFAYWAFVFG